MNKQSERLAIYAVAVGIIAYGVWAFYTLTVVLLLVIGLALIIVVMYNRRRNEALWTRNTQGRQREHRFVGYGIGALLAAVFVLATGRDKIGQLGAALIVAIGMIGILVVTISPKGVKK